MYYCVMISSARDLRIEGRQTNRLNNGKLLAIIIIIYLFWRQKSIDEIICFYTRIN